jgi:hypothetical protein
MMAADPVNFQVRTPDYSNIGPEKAITERVKLKGG